LVAIDHQHFLTETLLPRPDRIGKAFILGLFRIGTLLLGGKPDRIITSSFWHFPRRPGSRALLVGPFLATGMKCLRPIHGETVVVYLKRACYLNRLLPALLANPGRRFRIFSDWAHDTYDGEIPTHVELLPVHRYGFLTALSEAHSLITTAGNQVIGEAIYLGKPVFAFPEPDVLEQELNAAALQRSGFGESCELHALSGERLHRFLQMVPVVREKLQASLASRSVYDAGEVTLKALRRILRSRGVKQPKTDFRPLPSLAPKAAKNLAWG
jgi:Glycosyl transferase family 1